VDCTSKLSKFYQTGTALGDWIRQNLRHEAMPAQRGEQSMQPQSHMQDYEAHVRAVAADLEYFRTKRLESRVFLLARRGVVTLYDLLKARADVTEATTDGDGHDHRDHEHAELEQRIRALEDRLDAYVREIALLRSSRDDLVIEDNRKERGDYDPFFRIMKRHYDGAIEERIEQLNRDLDDGMLLVNSMLRALVQTGQTTQEQIDKARAEGAARGHKNGARIVARAWVDPEFKRNLIEYGREAVRELDIPPGRLGKLGVAENTDTVHNVVVCTLCSCYPTDLLGDAPWWYRQDSYKQRIIQDPRAMLEDMFGLAVPAQVEVRVHDSTSDVRWMVLPQRPAGTESLTEEELARLVTPESLVGAGPALEPSGVGAAPLAYRE
jgi:nitrile hydratase